MPDAVELPLAEPPVAGLAGPTAPPPPGPASPRGDVSPPRTVQTASQPGRAPIDDEKMLVFFFGTNLRSFSSSS